MAIFYFRTSIIKASSGKSAVATAAYQSAEKLFSERLGRTFSYKNKEEVVYSEVLLPQFAPSDYVDRQNLWNAVEEEENRCNSRYARQIIIAVPNEWTREETIARSREFIQNTFVNRGMAVDWAYHEKKADKPDSSDNHHIHLLCTVRGFNSDGTWQKMEKKAYALDENGNRIPDIDPDTGEQRIRRRIRDGHYSEEKLWKRITVQANCWNSRDSLKKWRNEWADYCNRYLTEENRIDHRSYSERGIEKLAMLHEGTAAREMMKRGIMTDVVAENIERKAINAFFEEAVSFLSSARDNLRSFRVLMNERRNYDQTGSYIKIGTINRDDDTNFRLSVPGERFVGRAAQKKCQGSKARKTSECSQRSGHRYH